jgi:hypothetical protein
MNRAVETGVWALQSFRVAFLLLHDWVPLGSLNDVQAVGAVDPLRKRIQVTLVTALPFALGLAFSYAYAMAPRHPAWVRACLWLSYGTLFAGEIRAWWIPYLWRSEPARTARYHRLFGNTHTFLPARNGIAPTPCT